MIFAANWKMHLGPHAGRELVRAVLARVRPKDGRTLLFFPPAVSLSAVVSECAGRKDVAAGVQNIYFEPKGAFTGEISAGIAAEAGASWVLVGHSERRHKFGETEAEARQRREERARGRHDAAPEQQIGQEDEEEQLQADGEAQVQPSPDPCSASRGQPGEGHG